MGDPNYAYGKLSIAIETLAVGPGDVRSRLNDAFVTFHPVHVEDFPSNLKDDWRWIEKQLTRYGPIKNWKGEVWRGSVEHTMSRIKRATRVKIAKRLLYVHKKLGDFLRDTGAL